MDRIIEQLPRFFTPGNVNLLLEAAALMRPERPDLHVLMVGGGPAGLAAARMAAVRGHRVILIEESDMLGGLFRLATRAPGRQETGDILAYFEAELARLQRENERLKEENEILKKAAKYFARESE